MRRIVPVLIALSIPACISQSSLDGMQIPTDVRASAPIFFVEHQPKDTRHLEKVVVEAMKVRGLDASLDSKDRAEYVVTYIDRWYWDMRMYLIDFRVDVRNANTSVLIATSRSYQTSLATMGQTYEEVIDATVAVLLDGMEAKVLERKQETAERKKGRRPSKRQ